MRGYVLSSAACGVSQIFPACGAPKFGVGPTPNLGRLYPCGSQNWDGRKKGGCRHSAMVCNKMGDRSGFLEFYCVDDTTTLWHFSTETL